METYSVVVDVPSSPSFAAGQWVLLGIGVGVFVLLLLSLAAATIFGHFSAARIVLVGLVGASAFAAAVVTGTHRAAVADQMRDNVLTSAATRVWPDVSDRRAVAPLEVNGGGEYTVERFNESTCVVRVQEVSDTEYRLSTKCGGTFISLAPERETAR